MPILGMPSVDGTIGMLPRAGVPLGAPTDPMIQWGQQQTPPFAKAANPGLQLLSKALGTALGRYIGNQRQQALNAATMVSPVNGP
jgi:hypothetical protein